MSKSVCSDCSAVVSDLGRHRRRGHCSAQHYHAERLRKQLFKQAEKERRKRREVIRDAKVQV